MTKQLIQDQETKIKNLTIKLQNATGNDELEDSICEMLDHAELELKMLKGDTK